MPPGPAVAGPDCVHFRVCRCPDMLKDFYPRTDAPADTHAIAILLKDHDTVNALFDRFARATAAEKNKIIAADIVELKIHASRVRRQEL